MWFAYELQRRVTGTGVVSLAVCPGFVPEAIGSRRTNTLERFLYSQLMTRMPFARSLDQASDAYLAVATDPHYGNMQGKFIVDGKDTHSSIDSYDQNKAKRLWDLSWTWCGLGDAASE